MPGAHDRSIADALSSTIEDAVAPLRKISEDIDADLAELDEERAELIANRRRVTAILRAIEPPKPKPRKKASGATGHSVNEDTLAALEKLMRAKTKPGQIFTTTEVAELDGEIASRSTWANAVELWHERGVLQLVGKNTGRGGAKRWKVT